jgi:CRP-like cAMP-binding protein
LLAVLENGVTIETALIGREGAFGLFAAMYDRVSFCRCLVQRKGGLIRAPTEALQLIFAHSEHVRNLFVRYSEDLLVQVQQTVACHAQHTVKQKMSRWLLMMHDRADGDDLPCTHEFMADMLGINRKSVTLTAQTMQNDGLITYRRGRMQVLDRPSLEKTSCECYAVLKNHFNGL